MAKRKQILKPYFSSTKKVTSTKAVEYVEDFQKLSWNKLGKRKSVTLRVPKSLLEDFRKKSGRDGVPYQTQIQRLMQYWLHFGE